MPITTAQKIRDLAGWPAFVTDPKLAPHIAGAGRELMRRVGSEKYAALLAAEASNEDRLCAEEIEGCLTIAYALPTVNAFVLAEGPVVPKEIEDTEFQFLTPEQAEDLAAIWRKRADDRFASWDWTDPADGETEDHRPQPGMYAI